MFVAHFTFSSFQISLLKPPDNIGEKNSDRIRSVALSTNMSGSFRFSISLSPLHSNEFPRIPVTKPRIHVPVPKLMTVTLSKVVSPLRVVAPGVMIAAVGLEVDRVTEAELKENRFRSTRRTKIVCTIGPRTCEFEEIEALAVGGMNVARVNICHGTRECHRDVIRRVRQLNEEKGFAVAVMMDTEGSEIHMDDLNDAESAKPRMAKYGLLLCEHLINHHAQNVPLLLIMMALLKMNKLFCESFNSCLGI
ncbi:hypothetical protein V6Z11_A08G217700 [Gossypium hirsutum]